VKQRFSMRLKGLTYVPRATTTDQPKSNGTAKCEILPSVEHRQHRYLHNWAEHSHQPTRQGGRTMRRFTSGFVKLLTLLSNP
jgi:putative transposase